MRALAGAIAGLIAVAAVLVPLTAKSEDGPAPAGQGAPAIAGVNLELNRLEQNGEACRATFVATNGYATMLEETAFELALFDTAGLVSLMTVFDFGALPAGKTLVKRFDMKGIACADLSRVLVNAASRCKGAGIGIADCAKDFTTSNRTGLEFGR